MLPEKNTAQVKTVLIFLTAAKHTKKKENGFTSLLETRSVSIL